MKTAVVVKVVVVNRYGMNWLAQLVACALSARAGAQYEVCRVNGLNALMPGDAAHAIVYLAPHPIPEALRIEMCAQASRFSARNRVVVYCVSHAFDPGDHALLNGEGIACHFVPPDKKVATDAVRVLSWSICGYHISAGDCSEGEKATVH